MKKRLLSLVLGLAMVCALAVPAAAYDMGKVGEDNVLSFSPMLTRPQGAVVDKDHVLWGWGYLDFSGRPKIYRSYITPAKLQENVSSVSCSGSGYIAFIKTDGSLWMWGECAYYDSLGDGNSNKPAWEPVKVLDDVVAVSCGDSHTAAIKTDGSLWAWGNNGGGKVGNLTEWNNREAKVQTTPVKVLDDVVAVSCGDEETAAIRSDGSLWMWGGGLPKTEYYPDGGTITPQLTPTKVMDDVVAVSCGENTTAVVKSDGSLWAWGYGDVFGKRMPHSTALEPVHIMDNVAAVSCDFFAMAAIKTDGTLWTWGNNDKGQLGNGFTWDEGNVKHQDKPKKIMDNVAVIRCGDDYMAAIQTDGSVWTWGLNTMNALGNGGKGNWATDYHRTIQTVPDKIMEHAAVPVVYDTPVPEEETDFPDEGIAYPSTQTVEVDGKTIEFQCYALQDENGNPTNYIKLRDLADILNGSAAQFEVGYDGNITITTQTAYTKNGSEQNTPFSGQRSYKKTAVKTLVDGKETELDTFQLEDDNGGGYTYYKLRDLGKALGITVDWSAEKGIFIETK